MPGTATTRPPQHRATTRPFPRTMSPKPFSAVFREPHALQSQPPGRWRIFNTLVTPTLLKQVVVALISTTLVTFAQIFEDHFQGDAASRVVERNSTEL